MERNNSDKQKKDLGLYIHIPFCVKKCDYCDFLSSPADEITKREYVKALIAEINSYKDMASEYLVKTIYIGGGTPSSIDGQYIVDIMNAIRNVFSVCGINDKIISKGLSGESPLAEITIEVNPGTITEEKLNYYKMAGINRLSIGLQSIDNKELKLLGRIHTFEEFEMNYQLARKLGFHNINIDLISALPGQTLQSWMCSLEKVISLNPEHISAYSLIIEEGTPFFAQYREEDQDEDLDRDIYAMTKERLDRAGYYRYEISNYAKPSFESKHNSSYWIRTEYLGLGLGASSLIHNTRFHNEKDLMEYIKLSKDYLNLRRNIEELDVNQQMEEFMFLGLRMNIGVNKEDFNKQFDKSIDLIYGEVIKKSIDEGLLLLKDNQIYLSDKGIDLSNLVMSRFLFDDTVRN